MNAQPQTWEDIEKHYLSLSGNNRLKESMMELIKYVYQSDLTETLHPWTSMFDLLITQTKRHPFQFTVPYLCISPSSDGSAEFRYIDTNVKSKQWVRNCDPGRFVERFESFIDQLHWRVNIS